MVLFQFCAQQGGYLAEIVSKNEQTNLNTILRDDSQYWIGLSDLATEGKFVWQHSFSPLREYTNWFPGEPNNINNEDCVSLWPHRPQGGWGWNDERCYTYRHALCKSYIGISRYILK